MTTPSKFEMQAQVLRMLLPPQSHDQAIASVAFSLNGSKIVLRSYDKTIQVWDASTSIEMLPPLQGHNDRVISITFSPNKFKIRSYDNTIQV
jgi:WD40 repeat protein